MKFERIFVESRVRRLPRTADILRRLPAVPIEEIDRISEVFEKARKPYLQKRTSLNLFLGRKDGQLVKPAPHAYGLDGDPHYYFIYAYNCIYECEYCYLQGYFRSPDIVLFVNHEEILAEISRIAAASPGKRVWFHSGEFSDSLALSHLSGEWPLYWEAFGGLPNARLELRTKSVNIRPILTLGPLPNIIVTFSLSPADAARQFDRQTPGLHSRLKAAQKLAEAGFRLGFHFDPIIYEENFIDSYRELIRELMRAVPLSQMEFFSLGVVRFTREVYQEFSRNYPQSPLIGSRLIKSFDGKMRYSRPKRLFLLKSIRNLLTEAAVPPQKIYLCMEDEAGGDR